MKRFIFVATLSAAVLVALTACHHGGKGVQGSGVRKTEKRDLGAFKSIETTGAYEIRITCQQPASFEIEADDNIVPLIRTEVRGDVLHISSDTGYRATKGITVRIAIPDLEGIVSQGAGDIHITNVKNDKLAIRLTGAARIEAAGETDSLSIATTGAGKIDANNLHARRADVTVTGAGNVDVYASERLDARVSGVGQVIYDGDPNVVHRDVSGIGSVVKKEGA